MQGIPVPEIKSVKNGTEAGKVSDFLLGPQCFDDQRFTPGETEQLRWLPMRSLQEKHIHCWYSEEGGEVTRRSSSWRTSIEAAAIGWNTSAFTAITAIASWAGS
jgi:hypothetical protein